MVLVFLAAGFFVGVASTFLAFVAWGASPVILLAVYSVSGALGTVGAAFVHLSLAARNRRQVLASESRVAPFSRVHPATAETAPAHGRAKG